MRWQKARVGIHVSPVFRHDSYSGPVPLDVLTNITQEGSKVIELKDPCVWKREPCGFVLVPLG
jgi:hypothetical protein